MNKIFKSLTVLVAALLLITVSGCVERPPTTRWNSPPAMQIDVTKTYVAIFDTDFGRFEVELLAAESPITVNNFVFLARQGRYNGTVFHRIVKEFMIQGGDLGLGNPGYSFEDELPPRHLYEPGIVAMANAGKNTNSSQFFICTGYQASSLGSNPNYTQFGRVISGMDVIMKIAAAPVTLNSQGEMSRPFNPPKINKVTIFEA